MSTPPSPAPTVAPAEGATGTPEGGQPTPAPEQTPHTPTADPAPETAPADGEPKGKAPKFDGEFDPKRFEKLVENLRGDVAAEKAKRESVEQRLQQFQQQAEQQQADLVKRFAEAFGIAPTEEQPPTPEELADQVARAQSETEASRAQARQTQVELAVYRSAGQHGGNPDALLDSRAFADSIKELDPASDSFAADVEAAVKKAVEGNPRLAAKAPEPAPAPAPPKGGADLAGAPGGKRQLTEADVKRMTPEQIVKAREAGQLNTYLGRGG